VKGARRKDNMARYYRLDEDEKSRGSNRLKSSDRAAKEEQEEEEEEMDEAELRWARMRGLVGPDTSSSEEESEEENEDKEDEEEERLAEELDVAAKEWGVGALAANPLEPIPLLPDATARLACVDLDWDHIRSVDILVALRSFLPKGGSITKVTVYPSDYGLERIAEEAASGPQGIWGSSRTDDIGDDDHDSADEDQNGSTDGADSDDNEIDMERLRLYERSKLRWYYAIVECDSAATANTLYEECDGMEIMKSACKFDLRFVPDDQTFKNRQIRDSATDVPSDYEAPVFQTRALQHTNVELTWDKEDEGRKKALTKKLTVDELKDDDFKAYLATDSDDGDGDDDGDGEEEGGDDPEAVRQRYLRLALLAEEKETENGKGGKKDEDEVDLEVTFEPGLESLAGRLAAKKEEAGRGGETVWEAYLRRKTEKKAEARRLGRHNVDSSDDDDFSDYSSEEGGAADGEGEDPFDDPFFKNDGNGVDNRKDKRQGKKEEESRGRRGPGRVDKEENSNCAELEMLLMDQHQLLENKAQTAKTKSDDKDGIGAKKSALKVKKNAKRPARKRTERDRGSDDEEIGGAGFAVDLDDPRFKGLFASPDFALDPTDPRFAKAGPNAARMASEVAKRRSAMVGARQSAFADKSTVPKAMNAASTRTKDSNGELKLMVASLKRKAKSAPSAESFPKHKR
jgi:hypothetical protein